MLRDVCSSYSRQNLGYRSSGIAQAPAPIKSIDWWKKNEIEFDSLLISKDSELVYVVFPKEAAYQGCTAYNLNRKHVFCKKIYVSGPEGSV